MKAVMTWKAVCVCVCMCTCVSPHAHVRVHVCETLLDLMHALDSDD